MRTIPQIDKDITAVYRQVQRLEQSTPASAEKWQEAWDRHPDLYARERALYRERGQAQLARDEAQAAMARKAALRPLPRKKCSACGTMVLAR